MMIDAVIALNEQTGEQGFFYAPYVTILNEGTRFTSDEDRYTWRVLKTCSTDDESKEYSMIVFLANEEPKRIRSIISERIVEYGEERF